MRIHVDFFIVMASDWKGEFLQRNKSVSFYAIAALHSQ
jgi:hypothetical protein